VGNIVSNEFSQSINKGQIFEYITSLPELQKEELKIEFDYFLKLNDKREMQCTGYKNYDKTMFRLAFYDSLTDIPKRNYFKIKSEEIINKNINEFTILFFDIDDLKKVNDNFGYILGDKWLKTIIFEINKELRVNEQIFKWGGDEFIVLLKSTNMRYVSKKANLILEICNKVYGIQDRSIQLSASMGISFYKNDATGIDEVLKKADIAMGRAKMNGKNNCVFFHEDMQRKLEEKLQLEIELKKAITNKEFILYFQPLFSLKKSKVIGVEALIRWKHPNKGLVFPVDFIPLSEENGLIKDIGRLVIEEAFKQSRNWQDKGYGDIKISINISDIQLRDENFISYIKESFKKYEVDPKNIVIEVTETVMMESFERNIKIFKRLKNMGVKIALDDFGTGYSSLSYLKKLPIDIIKIDKMFIENIQSGDIDKSFVEAIIHFGHKINKKIVAEGVELKEQLNILKESGCDIIQGYFIGRPMEVTEINKILENEKIKMFSSSVIKL
jgi:diguanylate cyclase (GGDEF)-like protein